MSATAVFGMFRFGSLVTLFLLQIVSIVGVESLVGRLTLCDTLFLLVASVPRAFKSKCTLLGNSPNATPFFRTIACVVAGAMLFVGFTHSLEVIFCSDEPDRVLPLCFVAVAKLNLVYKLLWICLDTGEDAAMMKPVAKIAFSLAAPAMVVSSYWASRCDDARMHQLAHLDPYVSIVLCLLMAAIVGPIFVRHIPYLLCNAPESLDIPAFKAEAAKKLPGIRIEELHAFITWPGEQFEVIMRVSTVGDVNDEEETWMKLVELKGMLRKAGAGNVTIQPNVRSESEMGE